MWGDSRSKNARGVLAFKMNKFFTNKKVCCSTSYGKRKIDCEMRIIITDTGNIWNFENPFLEQFRDIIFVVCLEGREATDKYLCFVSPYRQVEMGMDNYGAEDQKLKVLISVAEKLNHELGYHEDIVFLSDNEPSTLYPYYVLKDLNKYNKFHLIAMPPWDFESRRRRDTYRQMLANLSALRSILYYDSQNILDAIGKKSTIAQALQHCCYIKTGFM